MRLFGKKRYVEESVSEMSGRKGPMVVTVRNMMVRKEPDKSDRRFPYRGFGVDLNERLCQLVRLGPVRESLERGDSFAVSLALRKLPEMTIEISGSLPSLHPDYNNEEFYSDFLDALVDAWEQNGITL